MKEWIVPTAGGVLASIGLALVAAHVNSWKQEQHALDLEESERAHLAARFRRRLQASGMIAVLGVLIAVGDQLPILRLRPVLFGLYWLGVLLLTAWVMLLAVGDFFSTRAHGRTGLARLRKKQLELEQQIAEIKRRGSNGRDKRR